MPKYAMGIVTIRWHGPDLWGASLSPAIMRPCFGKRCYHAAVPLSLPCHLARLTSICLATRSPPGGKIGAWVLGFGNAGDPQCWAPPPDSVLGRPWTTKEEAWEWEERHWVHNNTQSCQRMEHVGANLDHVSSRDDFVDLDDTTAHVRLLIRYEKLRVWWPV
jgi:hypothetical protein